MTSTEAIGSIPKARQAAESEVLRANEELEKSAELLREETRVLELLNETATMIGSTLDLSTILQAVTDRGTELCGAQFGAFFYTTTNESGEALMLFTLSGAPREAFEKFGHPRATTLFGPTFSGKGPIRCADVRLDERYGQMGPHYGMPKGHLPVRSYLAVPVKSGSGEVIGGLFFGHALPGVFTERSERLIVGVASQAGIAIDNARLYESAKKAGEAERRARTEAERIGLMKDEFLATLSHELRTPLNSILGWAELLLGGGCSSNDLIEGLKSISRNARSQTQLIEDLLDMSRIISGKIRIDVQRTSLRDVIDAAIAAIRPSLEAKQIRLTKVLDPSAGPISGDPNRLQQVIWNLLSNAVKFTPKGGRIDVLLERVDSHLEIAVSDTGSGIDPDFLPFVFDRFRQADSSATRKFGGLGLGLSIVKHLVELHGGSVRAKSDGLDQGATFVVALPLAPVHVDAPREHPGAPREPVSPPAQVRLDGVLVLVIDDEPDARELIRRVLVRSNATVLTAANVDEALKALKTEKPDVLISDIGMPDKDGYDLIHEVRSLAPSDGGLTPAVALTAFARSDDRTKAMLAGFQMHLAKPIEPNELVATVASLAGPIGKRRLR